MKKKSVNEGLNRFLGYQESRPVMPMSSNIGGKSTVKQHAGNSESMYYGFGDMDAVGNAKQKTPKGAFFQLNTIGVEGDKSAKMEGMPGRETFYTPSQAVLPLMSFLDRLKTPDNGDTMDAVNQGVKVIFLSPDSEGDEDGDYDEDDFCCEDDGEDIIHGGLGDNRKVTDFNIHDLMKGMEIEAEHTNDPRIAKEITEDHLTENDDYYDYLEDMEREMNSNSRHGLNESQMSKKQKEIQEPFGTYYKTLADTADKKRAGGFDWRKDAQIEQFAYKDPDSKKTLRKDLTNPDKKNILYIRKNEK